MRLDKFLANQGIGTRTEVKKYIQKGRVTVNGEIEKQPEKKVSEQDEICFDGERLGSISHRYYMFHKPAGCVSANRDETFETVLDYFTKETKWQELMIVGRLDKDTEGLLLVTDDGAFCHEVISPKKHVAKTYYFESDEALCEDAVRICKEGIVLKDGTKCSPSILEMIDEKKGYLTIYEGAYHQIKRMVAYLGGHVAYLKRLSIGELTLDKELKLGEYKRLTEEEAWQAICQSQKKI